MNRLNKEFELYSIRSNRFRKLCKWLTNRGIKHCATKTSVEESIEKYCS